MLRCDFFFMFVLNVICVIIPSFHVCGYWQYAGSCDFFVKVMSTCEAASSSTRSPTNPLVVPQTSPPPLSTQASTSTPSTNSSALPQSSPPSSQVAVMRKNELLVEALEVAQSMSASYLNIIKKFADLELNAHESNDE